MYNDEGIYQIHLKNEINKSIAYCKVLHNVNLLTSFSFGCPLSNLVFGINESTKCFIMTHFQNLVFKRKLHSRKGKQN